MFELRNLGFFFASFLRHIVLAVRAAVRRVPRSGSTASERNWAQRPGLGVMYQIETRPGWKWDRDYVAFNRSLQDHDGAFAFDGPLCDMSAWVALSTEIGLDYHVFEVKWHDGICWFDTDSTAWKTPHDYTRDFSDLSRAAGLPFAFYYSAVFDHNPQFDAIQPDRTTTPSFVGEQEEYRGYLLRHYEELVGAYQPDAMWFDWYWPDGSTEITVETFRSRYPDVVVTFNLANLFPASFRRIGTTSSEAHSYDGPWVRFRKEDSLRVPVLTSSVRWSNLFRMSFDHQWELCSPAGRWWQDQRMREDPDELLRTTAMVLACGGKLCIGATAQMNGQIFPDQQVQLRHLGAWYQPRKTLFVDAAPLRYRGFRPPGVRVTGGEVDVVASVHDGGHLLHLVNRTGLTDPLQVTLDKRRWGDVRAVTVVPDGVPLPLQREGGRLRLELPGDVVDRVDTILHLTP